MTALTAPTDLLTGLTPLEGAFSPAVTLGAPAPGAFALASFGDGPVGEWMAQAAWDYP